MFRETITYLENLNKFTINVIYKVKYTNFKFTLQSTCALAVCK